MVPQLKVARHQNLSLFPLFCVCYSHPSTDQQIMLREEAWKVGRTMGSPAGG